MQAASGGEGAGPGPSSQKQQEQEQEQQRQGGPGVKKHIGSNTMGMVLDLLCFCVQHHGYRSAPASSCTSPLYTKLHGMWSGLLTLSWPLPSSPPKSPPPRPRPCTSSRIHPCRGVGFAVCPQVSMASICSQRPYCTETLNQDKVCRPITQQLKTPYMS